MTAMENLRFYAKIYDITDIKPIENILKDVGLFRVRHEPVRSFSKGMKQRLSLARALLHRPRFLLLDEPFDGLDAESEDRIKLLLLSLHESGVGWVLVSHDVHMAWSLCDRTVLLHQGCIHQEIKCHEQEADVFLQNYRRLVKESPHAFF